MRSRRTALALTALALAGSSALTLAPASPASADQGTDTRQLLVQLAAGADANTVAQSVGGTVSGALDPLGVTMISVPADQITQAQADLQARNDVTYAEPDSTVAVASTGTPSASLPTDPLYSDETGPRKINAEPVWSVTHGSSGTIIAVIDTGVNSPVGDLDGVLGGIDLFNKDNDPTDDQGHGTATAHVLAATWNNGIRTAGMCEQCSILPVKVFGATGAGPVSLVASGIVWAVDHGAKVINLSLSTPVDVVTLRNAVAYANSHGAVVVAAAGNNNATRPTYPAAYPGVLGVAATELDDTKTSYSNYGPWVSVAAPGTNPTTIFDGRLVSFQGTSSATPLVSGAAALLLSARPNARAADVVNALKTTAAPVPGNVVTNGRIDANRALNSLPIVTSGTLGKDKNAGPDLGGDGNDSPNSSSQSFTYGTPVRAHSTLTFTDVKKLILTITGPDGRRLVKRNIESGDDVTVDLPAGTSTWTVSGSTKASYTLTITTE